MAVKKTSLATPNRSPGGSTTMVYAQAQRPEGEMDLAESEGKMAEAEEETHSG